MRLEILGAESLGARGLCCRIETRDRVVVVDPGVALGAWRHGLPPHPVQVAVGREIRRRIVSALAGATDVVFSHFHGDHVPLLEPNPYQLGIRQLPADIGRLRAWSLSPSSQTATSRARAADLMELFGSHFRVAEGRGDGDLWFSEGVAHGGGGPLAGSVMLTRVDVGGRVFVHASDTQLLSASTVDLLLELEPHWVLAAGPPLYQEALGHDERRRAWANALRLARGVSTLVLDHHLLRSAEGAAWLDRLSAEAGRRVQCAADFMGRPRRLLEARRRELYAAMPVRTGWHDAYARGRATVDDFGPSRA
ncbi:MAG: hypothetical protein JW767_05145 [Thermoleophilia bacterium]|nr:hypothetical protein [Thermoleophilia bacterium]